MSVVLGKRFRRNPGSLFSRTFAKSMTLALAPVRPAIIGAKFCPLIGNRRCQFRAPRRFGVNLGVTVIGVLAVIVAPRVRVLHFDDSQTDFLFARGPLPGGPIIRGFLFAPQRSHITSQRG